MPSNSYRQILAFSNVVIRYLLRFRWCSLFALNGNRALAAKTKALLFNGNRVPVRRLAIAAHHTTCGTGWFIYGFVPSHSSLPPCLHPFSNIWQCMPHCPSGYTSIWATVISFAIVSLSYHSFLLFCFFYFHVLRFVLFFWFQVCVSVYGRYWNPSASPEPCHWHIAFWSYVPNVLCVTFHSESI